MTEARRYLTNARGILRGGRAEAGVYVDGKPVRETCGTAYLAILIAIDAFLMGKGLLKKQLPRSVNAYRSALQQHLSAHNGKLLREFDSLYDLLHIAGYYRGLLSDVAVVSDALSAAERFVGKIEGAGRKKLDKVRHA